MEIIEFNGIGLLTDDDRNHCLNSMTSLESMIKFDGCPDGIKKMIQDNKHIDPEIQTVINDGLWDMLCQTK